MKFSVLLSLYYKENPDFLRQSLESVFSQTLSPDEVVLVEDGALTEDLYAEVNAWQLKRPEMKIVKLERNCGLGKALNEGLKHCSNELVARMDTDDVCKPWRFERQVAFMKSHPDIAVCGSWIDEFEGEVSNVRSTRKPPQDNDKIYEFGKKRNPMNHPVVMFRKSAVEAAGNYLPMPLFEDYYLWVRMLLLGYKFHNIQESLLNFRFCGDVFKRRGGLKYAWTETIFQWKIYRLHYIDKERLMENIAIRFITRIIPNRLRRIIYKKLLRK